MFEKGRRVVVFGDMNGRVGNSELAGMVGGESNEISLSAGIPCTRF